jgi:eukaryotic-like serine/threonine-protein kinase
MMGRIAAEPRNRFDLVEIVGSGGMGEVWRARDRVLRREVAIKCVHAKSSTSQQDHTASTRLDTTRTGPCLDGVAARRLAIREARAAAQLNHPNAVRVLDVIDLDGFPCVVMEYVPGRSLYDLVRDDGPLAWLSVANIGVAVLDALDAAHRVGVLHRDVKPSNILVARDGRIVLTDFGTASRQGVDGDDGHVVGTPAYLAPERASAGLSLPAGDVWSLGATLYFAVEGRSPYSRVSVLATLAAAATCAPDPYVRAGELEPALDAMLGREPHQRPSTRRAHRMLTCLTDRTGSDAAPVGSHRWSAPPSTYIPATHGQGTRRPWLPGPGRPRHASRR